MYRVPRLNARSFASPDENILRRLLDALLLANQDRVEVLQRSEQTFETGVSSILNISHDEHGSHTTTPSNASQKSFSRILARLISFRHFPRRPCGFGIPRASYG